MRLYRFEYSGYARFVQAAIQLTGAPCELVDVAFGERDALATLTGGYIQVPVLVGDDGAVITDSRRIVATLVREDPRFAALVPANDAGPIWAYVDWVGSGFEDVAFRIASPLVEPRMAALNGGRDDARGMYRFVKERKFGPGCIDQWAKASSSARSVAVVAPRPVATRSASTRGWS